MPYPLPMDALDPLPAKTHAMIDIGSNSVRMVVYHADVRVPVPLFNEKYLCGLGAELASSGRLSEEAKQKTRIALERFLLMADRLAVTRLDVVATAALRDAENGAEFKAELEKIYQLTVDVIDGEQEAILAAKGIMASIHNPHGIAVDLGGGSMELAYVKNESIIKKSTMQAGVLRLLDACGYDADTLRDYADKAFSKISWIGGANTPTLYAIGGSFRNIAKWHMRNVHYPLDILHEYRLSYSKVKEYADYFSTLPPEDIAELSGISSKRAATTLPAAIMLERAMHYASAKTICFSVSGIREGFLFDHLSPSLQSQDPLIASAGDLAALTGRRGDYAEELYDWIEPLFDTDISAMHRLRKAACILSELAWTIDPNFRGEWAYFRVIQSSIKGLNHKERVMLAMALYYRYHRKWKLERAEFSLLDERERLWAKCVGHAMNLAFHLSGGYAGNLHHATWQVQGDAIELQLDQDAKPLRTAEVEKHIDGLGSTWRALSNLRI